ncbi:MAG: hypothetical protein AMXMBFR82_07750 [Candidatus Hydrogenedentota bacterium]
MDKHNILGVHITNRIEKASVVQDILTKYGCNIQTRIGLHEVDKNHCAPNGLIVLELFGDEAICDELRDTLKAVKGVEVQQMIFDHPH